MWMLTTTELNEVVNHPDIHPAWGVDQEIDMSNFYNEPKNIAYASIKGVVVFGYRGDGVYEVHMMKKKKIKAKEYRDLVRQCINTLFTVEGADVIIGQPPRSNRAACFFANTLGFQKQDEIMDGLGRKCNHYELRKEQWVTLSVV